MKLETVSPAEKMNGQFEKDRQFVSEHILVRDKEKLDKTFDGLYGYFMDDRIYDVWYDPKIKNTFFEFSEWAIDQGYYDDIYTLVDHFLPGDYYKTELGQRIFKDSKEYKEAVFEMIDQKVFFADKFCEFEKIVLSRNEKQKKAFLEKFSEVLPVRILKILERIAKKYNDELDWLDSQWPELSREVNVDDEAALGDFIFNKSTGLRAKAPVYCYRQEAYLVFEFESKEDHRRFHGDEEDTGGIYHRSFSFPFEHDNKRMLSMKAITINRGFVYDRDQFVKVMLHEKQHFINDTIGLEGIEQNYFWNEWRVKMKGLGSFEQTPSHDTLYQVGGDIKNELLAFLREGHPLQQISVDLKTGLYEHIFEKLSAQEKEKVIRQLNQIIDLLGTHEVRDRFKKYNDPNGALIYFLIEIPFGKMVPFLKKMAYQKQEEKVRQRFTKEGELAKKRKQALVDQYESGELDKAA